MLLLKKNIYEPGRIRESDFENGFDDAEKPYFDPYNFLFYALTTDRQIFFGLQGAGEEEGRIRLKTLFPHASRFGTAAVLNAISKRLLEGLVNRTKWYELNSYHLCYLYDTLYGLFEEYSYSDERQRRELFPELAGRPIDFNRFLKEFFFNTGFLMDPQRFNEMSPEQKERLKLTDPCLFGVINKLIPTQEEIVLKIYQGENPFEKYNKMPEAE